MTLGHVAEETGQLKRGRHTTSFWWREEGDD